MDLDDLAPCGKPGFPRDAGQRFQKFGGDVFFDLATVVANRHDRSLAMPAALARDEGVERFEPVHAAAIDQSGKGSIDRLWCEARVLTTQASEHLVSGHRCAVASQDSQHVRLHSFSTMAHQALQYFTCRPLAKLSRHP